MSVIFQTYDGSGPVQEGERESHLAGTPFRSDPHFLRTRLAGWSPSPSGADTRHLLSVHVNHSRVQAAITIEQCASFC